MPIFTVQDKRVLFIHVPKTGGTAVAQHLSQYMDVSFDAQPPGLAVRLLPRHLHAEPLQALLSTGMFDWTFMVVRDPVERLASEYRYQKRKPRPVLPPSLWLRRALWHRSRNPYYRDNHFRPQFEFECFGAEVFRYEDGLEHVIEALNRRIGTDIPRALGRDNVSPAIPVRWSRTDLALIGDTYADDFARYGYERRAVMP